MATEHEGAIVRELKISYQQAFSDFSEYQAPYLDCPEALDFDGVVIKSDGERDPKGMRLRDILARTEEALKGNIGENAFQAFRQSVIDEARSSGQLIAH